MDRREDIEDHIEQRMKTVDDKLFHFKSYKLPGCVIDRDNMNSFINIGLPYEDDIRIFGLSDIQLHKSKEERAVVLMNRVFAHNFLVKLPHSVLLS
jgi:hypothetical protein